MDKNDIQFGDWHRMLLGEAPPEFLIEIIIRVFFVYLILLISMRLLGKRMSAQLSRNELLAMVCLAAAIGVPILSPDRGLLPMLIIAVVVVLISRSVARWAFKDQRFEHLSQDNVCMLVTDSVMDMGNMKQTRVTPERLCAQLRHEGIKHLGEVKRLYIEANGSFTLIREDQPKPGLSVLPKWDKELVEEQPKDEKKVCSLCGKPYREEEDKNEKCAACNNDGWVNAIC